MSLFWGWFNTCLSQMFSGSNYPNEQQISSSNSQLCDLLHGSVRVLQHNSTHINEYDNRSTQVHFSKMWMCETMIQRRSNNDVIMVMMMKKMMMIIIIIIIIIVIIIIIIMAIVMIWPMPHITDNSSKISSNWCLFNLDAIIFSANGRHVIADVGLSICMSAWLLQKNFERS